MGPHPAVAAVRLAVRHALAALPPGEPVLVACSGGADSLALAGAVAFEAAKADRRAGGITVDHRLQAGSAKQAVTVADVMARLGLSPVEVSAVTVAGAGGPEAAAREARYAALDRAAARLGAGGVLLGHTRNDQAETVLLGLARGSGGRSLAGMPPVFTRGRVRYLRPLLELDRQTLRKACLAMELDPWDDPHNADSAYARTRVRRDALPALEAALGPGVTEALARTARLLRDDADALDAWAEQVHATTVARPRPESQPEPRPDAGPAAGLAIAVLEELPRAVRTRVLRRAAIAAGCPPGALAAVHITALDELVTRWHGQRYVDLPGGIRGRRRYGRLLLMVAGSEEGTHPSPDPDGGGQARTSHNQMP